MKPIEVSEAEKVLERYGKYQNDIQMLGFLKGSKGVRHASLGESVHFGISDTRLFENERNNYKFTLDPVLTEILKNTINNYLCYKIKKYEREYRGEDDKS